MKRLIKSDYLARVEGEGGFVIEIRDGQLVKVSLGIFEAPRFFESFLRGRPYTDVVDFTARICGICPVAYQMTSVHALEDIFGVTVPKCIRELRRLMYCGEWIESHALHICFLHGPDFYGIESAWASRKYREIAKRGLRFKKLGNDILTILGGRPIHPVSVRVGGFYKTPDKKVLSAMLPDLEKAYEESVDALRWASALPFTDDSQDREYVSLRHPAEYPLNEGNIISDKGMDMTSHRFLENIQEYQVEYSTALHSGLKRDTSVAPYMVGPVSRLNLNHDRLPSEIKRVTKESGITLPIKNVQMAILARSVEISYAIYEAMRIIRDYEEPDKAFIESEPRPGTSVWATEAPRGILIHRYEVDERGYVKNCSIIPPTSQNLSQIEIDISFFVKNNLDKSPDYIRKETEKIIRSYDPCISCSSHIVILKD